MRAVSLSQLTAAPPTLCVLIRGTSLIHLLSSVIDTLESMQELKGGKKSTFLISLSEGRKKGCGSLGIESEGGISTNASLRPRLRALRPP